MWHPMRWHIFCRVIDNYGDAGVCWRLAADLSQRGEQVCLFIDEPEVLSALLDPSAATAVMIRHWPDSSTVFSAHDVGDVVIEAFACDPPDSYIAAMAERAQQDTPPAWINLEYLSAEDWVGSHHRLPSPHPHFPLTKYFYFPGFTPDSGGLLREPCLLASAAQKRVSTSDGTDTPLRIFLFSYAQPALAPWLGALRNAHLTLPPCPARAQLNDERIELPLDVTLTEMPFVPQSQFDVVLNAHDLLFVRGEDSFVRAQWAGKPVFWQIYPQEDGAHLVKLRAFYERYLNPQTLGEAGRETMIQFMLAWNGAGPVADCARLWPEISRMLPALHVNAQDWRQQLLKQPDLVTQLREFVGDLVK